MKLKIEHGHLPLDRFIFSRNFTINSTWQKYFKNLVHVLENIFWVSPSDNWVRVDTFACVQQKKISKIIRRKQIPTPITISVLYYRSDFSVLRWEYKLRRNMKIEWATCLKSSIFVKFTQWYDSNCSQLEFSWANRSK